MNRRSAPVAGFTLIELLVVISIIALLIGILLPALGAARRSARTIQCQSNVRQLSIAFQGYSTDTNAFYPGDGRLTYSDRDNNLGNWVPGFSMQQAVSPVDLTKGSIYPYAESLEIFRCPEDEFTEPEPPNPGSSGLSYTVSNHIYNTSGRMPGLAVSGSISIGAIKIKKTITVSNTDLYRSPSSLIILVDEGGPNNDPDFGGTFSNRGVNDGFFENMGVPDVANANPGGPTSDKSKWYHSDGAAFGFADGHGEVRKRTDLEVVGWIQGNVLPSGRTFSYGGLWDPLAEAPLNLFE